MKPERTLVHIDGAARGNPGPAAYAAVIAAPGKEVVEEAETLGETTNNVAEYTALVKALERCRELGEKLLLIHSDSELLVKQMNGVYRVKSEELKQLYDQAQSLLDHFEHVEIRHVRREHNKRADELGNLALDGAPKPRPGTAAPAPAATAPTKKAAKKSCEAECIAVLEDAKAAWQDGENRTAAEVWQELQKVLKNAGALK